MVQRPDMYALAANPELKRRKEQAENSGVESHYRVRKKWPEK